MDIPRGSITALVGQSGSGKSTLLHLIGALDTPSSGTVTVDGTVVTDLRGDLLADYRRRTGFVFQQFHLIPTLTVLDNVLAPNIPTKTAKASRGHALELLASVGLAGRENTPGHAPVGRSATTRRHRQSPDQPAHPAASR